VAFLSQEDVDVVVNLVIAAVFTLIMPAAVLVTNAVVAIQVRRAAIHSAANLGVQPHHQSTSAVPTIMLITTSLVYVLFQTMRGILYVLWRWAMTSRSNFSRETFVVVDICFFVVYIIYRPIYAYNFYVYLITGKLFRSDLRKLICRCLSSSSSAPAPAPAIALAHGAPAPIVIADDDVDDDDDDARRARADIAV